MKNMDIYPRTLILLTGVICQTYLVVSMDISCNETAELTGCFGAMTLLAGINYRIASTMDCICRISDLNVLQIVSWRSECIRPHCSENVECTNHRSDVEFRIEAKVPLQLIHRQDGECSGQQEDNMQLCFDGRPRTRVGEMVCSSVLTPGSMTTAVEGVTTQYPEMSTKRAGLSKDVTLGLGVGAGFLVVLGSGILIGYLCRKRREPQPISAPAVTNPTYKTDDVTKQTNSSLYELQSEPSNYAYIDITNIRLSEKPNPHGDPPPDPPARPHPATSQPEAPYESSKPNLNDELNSVVVESDIYSKVKPSYLRRPESDLVVVDNVTYQKIDEVQRERVHLETVKEAEQEETVTDIKVTGDAQSDDTDQDGAVSPECCLAETSPKENTPVENQFASDTQNYEERTDV